MSKKKSPKKTSKPAAAKAPPAKPAPKAPKKGAQLRIAGTERLDRIPEIDKAAEAYREVRDTRMQYTKSEAQAKSHLMEVAKKHGVTAYVYDSEDGEEFKVEYTAKSKENVKVRSVKADDAGDDD